MGEVTTSRTALSLTGMTLAWMTLAAVLSACGGGGSSATPATPGPAPGGNPDGAAIVAWGDSWTAGVGAVAGMSFPEQLQALTGRPVFNGGVSGQTSDQIAARQGGVPALLTLPGDSLPGSGRVTIQEQSTLPVSAEGPGPITGELYGIRGTLSYDGNLVFQSDTPGAEVTIPPKSPFVPDTFGSRGKVNVFWMGSNNFYDAAGVETDIALCVAFLSSGKFIVLALLNAGSEPRGSPSYREITQLNASLAAAYPDNFIDVRQVLVDSYDPASAEDVRDHSNDVPPASLRNDDQHPNEAGYAIVAREVAGFIRTKGW